MLDVFQKAMSFTLDIEKGYSNNPNDKGGETYCGIARKYHPSWEGWQIIDDIKEEYANTGAFPERALQERAYPKVIPFYRDNFWKPLMLDKVHLINIAIKIFDMGVNLGVPRAASIVQACLNVMNYGLNYELKVDNIIGNMTVNLINQMTKEDNGELLLKLLTIQQGYIYMKIASNNPSQEEFIGGWINRLHMKVNIP